MDRGKYIVIEGQDGTGKSTQVEVLRDYLQVKGIDSIEIHEPGGVPIADRVREIIKDGTLERDPTSNLLLFTMARRAIWLQAAEPALQEGLWVVSARNWLSTIAYQGQGEGVDEQTIIDLTRTYVGEAYMQPDGMVVLSMDDAAERTERISRRGSLEQPDTFESKDVAFQDRVQQAYTRYARDHSIAVVSANETIDDVARAIRQELKGIIPE